MRKFLLENIDQKAEAIEEWDEELSDVELIPWKQIELVVPQIEPKQCKNVSI